MHYSAVMARSVALTATPFARSIDGLQHTQIEDTAKVHFDGASDAFDDLVRRMPPCALAPV